MLKTGKPKSRLNSLVIAWNAFVAPSDSPSPNPLSTSERPPFWGTPHTHTPLVCYPLSLSIGLRLLCVSRNTGGAVQITIFDKMFS